MQALYAQQQAQTANHQLMNEAIDGQFQPDLNSMDYQDKPRLDGYRQLATLLLAEAINSNQPARDDDVPTAVLKAANDGFLAYNLRTKRDRARSLQLLLSDAKDIYADFVRVLLLLIDLGKAAELDRARTYRDVDEDPFPLTGGLDDSRLIRALAAHEPLELEALRRDVSWANEQAFVRKAYRDVLKADDVYRAYCDQSTHNTEEDQAVVQHVFRQLILKHDTFREYLSELDLRWAENADVVKSLVVKTLKSALTVAGLTLEPLTDDWEEDEAFMTTLFDAALDHDADYETLLADQLQNWAVERVAMIDRVILKVAMAELLHFPGIPTKVTINEYIELAKEYSTPESGKFVNGVLDNLSAKLTESGRLRKSGKGLLDNK
jgi:transcription antitermination protein NusB